MSKQTLELLQGLVGCMAFTAWVVKYYMHFIYRKAYDPQLKNINFAGFLFPKWTFTSLKLAFCIPWISPNKQAESQVKGLAQKRRVIVALCISFLFIFTALIVLSSYSEAHFKLPD